MLPQTTKKAQTKPPKPKDRIHTDPQDPPESQPRESTRVIKDAHNRATNTPRVKGKENEMTISWRSILSVGVLLLLNYGTASAERKTFEVPWNEATKEAARKGYCFVTEKAGYFAVNSGGKASSTLLDIAGDPNKVQAQISNGNQLHARTRRETRFYMFADFPKCRDGKKPKTRGPARARNYYCSSEIELPKKHLEVGWRMIIQSGAFDLGVMWKGPKRKHRGSFRHGGEVATLKFWKISKKGSAGGQGIRGTIILKGPDSAVTWKEAFKPGGPCR